MYHNRRDLHSLNSPYFSVKAQLSQDRANERYADVQGNIHLYRLSSCIHNVMTVRSIYPRSFAEQSRKWRLGDHEEETESTLLQNHHQLGTSLFVMSSLASLVLASSVLLTSLTAMTK